MIFIALINKLGTQINEKAKPTVRWEGKPRVSRSEIAGLPVTGDAAVFSLNIPEKPLRRLRRPRTHISRLLALS
jgi:hypothetical protein